MSRPIRVVVADDDPRVREALADVVGEDAALELVGAAEDADGAIAMARAHRPDVAVLDVKMPGGGGPRAAREIRAACPETHVLALSAYGDRGAVLEVLRAGAVGYVMKGAAVEEILEGIHRAGRGEGTLSSGIAAEVIGELAGRLERETTESERERRRRDGIEGVLDGEALAVVFQPIFDLGSGAMVGAEALARFTAEPQRGPDWWFAEAAAVGLGTELETAAVRAAVRYLDDLPSEAYLSLNISPATATSGLLPRALSGLPNRRTVLEITEHAAVDDYDALADALRDIRSAGGRLAIDDAGAGFASLRHIVRLGPDIIKLDISLTRAIHTDRIRRALASALISFASEVEAAIVAEGVETRDELDALVALGVPYAQGYYLARPVPAPGFSALLESISGADGTKTGTESPGGAIVDSSR